MSIANFGLIPYEQTLHGRLYYDNNQKEHDCTTIENITIDPSEYKFNSPIVMVEKYNNILTYRHNCGYIDKALAVQKIHGSVALIVHNETVSDIIEVPMHGNLSKAKKLHIPTVLISKEDGEKLKRFYIENKDNPATLESIRLEINFEVRKSDHVNLEIFYTNEGYEVLNLLSSINNEMMASDILDKINIKLHYITTEDFNYFSVIDKFVLGEGCTAHYS
jgi:hypothetical protein